jgi:hypothetical protein
MTASVAGLFLSLVGLVGLLLTAADEPFVDEPALQADPFEPSFLAIALLVLSLVSLCLACFAYSAWSYREAQRLRGETGRRRTVMRITATVEILQADHDSLDESERRLKFAVLALLTGGVVLVSLLEILGVVNLVSGASRY